MRDSVALNRSRLVQARHPELNLFHLVLTKSGYLLHSKSPTESWVFTGPQVVAFIASSAEM